MQTDSLIDNIVPSECNNNVVVYVNSIWANGKMGSITDAKGDGVFRFFEMKAGKFSAEVISSKPEDNPIVATGIVAYCLHNRRYDNLLFNKLRLSNFVPQSIINQFVGYTAKLFGQYKEKREQEPNSWRCNVEAEFYTEFIIPFVKKQNKESEALFEYINPSDCQFVQDLMREYILYLEEQEKKYISSELSYEDSEESAIDKKVRAAFEKYLEENTASEEDIDEIFADIYGKDLVDKVNKELSETDEDTSEDDAVDEYLEDEEDEVRGDEDEVRDEEDEIWDDSMDYIFDKKVNPQAIFNAMKGIKYPKAITDKRFYFVVYKIFVILHYFSQRTGESDFMQWVNLHFNCGWGSFKENKNRFYFNLEDSSKNLKVQHPSEWNESTMYARKGIVYHQLAVDVKNTYTVVVDNGIILKDSDSFEHLKDRVEFLAGAHEVHGLLWAPDEAYINDGK